MHHFIISVVKVSACIILAVAVAEFITRWVMFKTFPIKMPQRKKVIDLQPNEQPEPPAEQAESNICTDISKIILKNFISACVDGDLSALGTGTEDELKRAFNTILSNYYAARKDDSIKLFVELTGKIKALELHMFMVSTLVSVMEDRYSHKCAEILKGIYKQFAFTPESYIEDLEKVKVGEIAHTVTRDRLKKQLEMLDEANKSDKKMTKQEQHESMISNLMDINKIEGVRYDVNVMTVLEYAVAENRKADYIKQLKEQANGR